ncbi:hypothetical protein J5571_04155 [Streptococcus suis]|uniref:hypothetical protein n=1 Tax=Streptococcus suis TaxID=1307 RepID=UPI00192D7332|nr:hypothetical protein [Streptococcus suis]MBL6504242.1 hypothetical protein [Streptococcus suis]MBM0240702.1 hypothetical protein [Streptococcus suis]MBM7204824.1 hypothetical protein [Streptococcus suis]MBM7282892.1 hypothetical protein [Streptococcus suis]MBO4115733.1 hypothetical protein [Streptococcus suis]
MAIILAIILAITHQKSPLQFLEAKKKWLKNLPNFWECNAQPLPFPLLFQKENHSHSSGMA